MIPYRIGCDVGILEHWPLDNPASAYRIVEGAPRTHGRIDAGGPGHTTRFGVWRCSIGAFECIEQGDELMTVLAGRGKVINHTTNKTVDLQAGDSLFIEDGSRVTWVIAEELTKVFHAYKANGY